MAWAILPADHHRRAARELRGQPDDAGVGDPPSWTSRFQRLNGVLPAMVQPHG